MDHMSDLSQAKTARGNGSIPREDYWRVVKNSVSSASQLSKLLGASGAYLTISSGGIVLHYPLTPNSELKFVVDSEDTRSIGLSVISEGRYEHLIQQALLEISRDSELFIDIGANAGFYSIAVRATSKKCKVLAFECNPDVRGFFLRNIELNSSSDIEVRSEALAESAGEADFYVPPFTGSGGGSLQNLHPDEGKAKKFQVSLIDLDSLGLKNVDLMKIDVEGAELGVIKGCLNSLEASKPTIFIELLRKWMAPFGSNPSDVSKVMVAMGYKIFEVMEDGIAPVDEISSDTPVTNFVFVHRSRPLHLEILGRLLKNT
jgi:FkbM family methyltransferase